MKVMYPTLILAVGLLVAPPVWAQDDEESFPGADEGCQNEDTSVLFKRFDCVNNFLCGLSEHFAATDGAVRDSNTGEKQAQVVIHFGHCAN